jgi:hypothetical protein
VQVHLFFWCVNTSHTFRPVLTLVNISACWADSMNCKVSRTCRKPLAVADRGLPSWAISPLTSSFEPAHHESRAVFHRLRGDSKQHRCAFMTSPNPTIKWSRRRLTMHADTHPCSWNAGRLMTASPNPTNNSGSSPRIPALLHAMARRAGPHIKA